MVTGLTYTMVGVVQRKYNFEDRSTGQKVFGVEVGWMGGTHSFMVDDLAAQDHFPDDGEPVEIAGILQVSKKGIARFLSPRVTTPRGGSSPAASGSKRA